MFVKSLRHNFDIFTNLLPKSIIIIKDLNAHYELFYRRPLPGIRSVALPKAVSQTAKPQVVPTSSRGKFHPVKTLFSLRFSLRTRDRPGSVWPSLPMVTW